MLHPHFQILSIKVFSRTSTLTLHTGRHFLFFVGPCHAQYSFRIHPPIRALAISFNTHGAIQHLTLTALGEQIIGCTLLALAIYVIWPRVYPSLFGSRPIYLRIISWHQCVHCAHRCCVFILAFRRSTEWLLSLIDRRHFLSQSARATFGKASRSRAARLIMLIQ